MFPLKPPSIDIFRGFPFATFAVLMVNDQCSCLPFASRCLVRLSKQLSHGLRHVAIM